MTDAASSPGGKILDLEDAGLSIDMLDVDKLRDWARLLLENGPDISYWGSVSFVVGKMQIMATEMEKAIRDIGALRSECARLRALVASSSVPQGLHDAIMNLRADTPDVPPRTDWAQGYRLGHRDARHAAAELVASLVGGDAQKDEK